MNHNLKDNANSLNGNGNTGTTTNGISTVTNNIATRQNAAKNTFAGMPSDKLMITPDRLETKRSDVPKNGYGNGNSVQQDFFKVGSFNPFTFKNMLMSETGFRYEIPTTKEVFIFKGIETEAKYINTLEYKPVPVGIPGATALRIGVFYENPENGELERVGYRDTLIYTSSDGKRIAVGSFSLPLEAEVTPLGANPSKDLVAHKEPENLRITENDAIWVSPKFRYGSGFKGVGAMLFEINVFLLQSMEVDELRIKRVFAINFHEKMGACPSLPLVMPLGASFGGKGLVHNIFVAKDASNQADGQSQQKESNPHNELYRAIKVLSRRRFAFAYNSWNPRGNEIGEREIISRIVDMYPEIVGMDGSLPVFAKWREYLSQNKFDYGNELMLMQNFMGTLSGIERSAFDVYYINRNAYLIEYESAFASRARIYAQALNGGKPVLTADELRSQSDVDAVYDLRGMRIPESSITRHNNTASDIFVDYRKVEAEASDPHGGFIRSLFHNLPIEGYF
ncbi:MAG TPA: hypothetical protein PLO51_02350 [Candidatus Micrarchaeota archaeon]|nr:hypothetical protein [Candidatus Micrarchaeota archaeon]